MPAVSGPTTGMNSSIPARPASSAEYGIPMARKKRK